MNTFKIEGSFLNKPTLTVDGQTVPFATLSAIYYPEEIIGGEKFNEVASLQFSVAEKIGNLEANTFYRVKAEVDGKLTFEEVDVETSKAGVPPQFIKKDKKGAKPAPNMTKCKECGKMGDKCSCDAKCKSKSFKDVLLENVTK